MGFFIGSIDNKQHLNLSDLAWINIEDDMNNFPGENNKYNLSGFLNKIIKNFHEEAKASITYRLNEQQDILTKTFNSIKHKEYSNELKGDLIGQLLALYKKELLESFSKYPSGEGRKFRINNANCEILEDLDDDTYYEGSIGLYLKYILEEYARKPIYEREVIYFKDFINTINKALTLKRELRITISIKQQFFLNPYSISTDKTGNFNYLVGYAINTNSKSDHYNLSSFRLSRITKIRINRSKSGQITKTDKKIISDLLAKKGPQFLSGQEVDVIVKLSSNGIKKYNNQINMRPLYTKITDKNNYHFKCTTSQIIYYFFKFGDDAIVISPNYLHTRMMNTYKNAFEAYDDYE